GNSETRRCYGVQRNLWLQSYLSPQKAPVKRQEGAIPSPALPGAGSTGLPHTTAELSAIRPPKRHRLAPLLWSEDGRKIGACQGRPGRGSARQRAPQSARTAQKDAQPGGGAVKRIFSCVSG